MLGHQHCPTVSGALPMSTPELREALFHILLCEDCRCILFERLLHRKFPTTSSLLPPEKRLHLGEDARERLRRGIASWQKPEEDAAIAMQHIFLSAELFAEAGMHKDAIEARLLLGLLFSCEFETASALLTFDAAPPLGCPPLDMFSAYARAFCSALIGDRPAARTSLATARSLPPDANGAVFVRYLLWLESRTALLLGDDHHLETLEGLVLDFCRLGSFEEAFLGAVDLATERAVRSLDSEHLFAHLYASFGSADSRDRLIVSLQSAPLPEGATRLYSLVSSCYRLRPLLAPYAGCSLSDSLDLGSSGRSQRPGGEEQPAPSAFLKRSV